MKLLNVLQAQSVTAIRTLGDFGYLPEALVALNNRYSFMEFPKQLQPPESNEPLTFRHGKMAADKPIVIDFLQIFPTGLAVTTHTNTSDSDTVLQDVLDWSKSQFGVQYEALRPGLVHTSQLEIRLDKSLRQLFPALAGIGAQIAERLNDKWWGPVVPTYELITLNFWMDETKLPPFPPAAFRLDRRKGVSFEQNVYWAEAPLRTDEHVSILEALELACIQAIK
jgi:hypothetical protein